MKHEMTSVIATELFFKRAKPEPTHRDLDVQFGVHLEEIVEMLECVTMTPTQEDERLIKDTEFVQGMVIAALKNLSNNFKKGHLTLEVEDRKEFLDSLLDQMVTAVGIGYMSRFKMFEAFGEVNASNLSKFDDNGNPIFDENGKIIKGPNYFKPDLDRFL